MSLSKRLLSRRQYRERPRPELKFDVRVSRDDRVRAKLIVEHEENWVKELWAMKPEDYLP